MISKIVNDLEPLTEIFNSYKCFLNLEQRVTVNMHIAKSNLPVLKIGQFWKVQN